MSCLEKHFLMAFGYQQLGCILLCLSVLGHSIQPIFQNRDRKGAGRIGEAGRQWNGLDRKHFSGTRPETAPGENGASAPFREPTESAPEPSPFREPTESAPEPAPFREPTESAPEPAPFREPTESAPEPAPFREPTESAPEPAPFREPRGSAPEPAPSREPRESAPEPAPFREPTESAPEPAPFREPTESAPEPAPFREPRESAPEPAPFREPTQSAPFREPTESAHKACEVAAVSAHGPLALPAPPWHPCLPLSPGPLPLHGPGLVLVLQPKWKTKNTKKINHSKPVKPVLLGTGKEWGLLVPKQKRQRAKHLHCPLVSLYSRNAVNVVQHLTFISQRTLQVRSYNFSHIRIS